MLFDIKTDDNFHVLSHVMFQVILFSLVTFKQIEEIKNEFARDYASAQCILELYLIL